MSLRTGDSQDEGGGSDGDDAAFLEAYAILVLQDVVHVEGAGVAGCIAQDVLQVASLVALHADDAVLGVDAGVDGVDGAVDVAAQHLATEDVVAHVEGDDLLVVEHVLYDYNAALLFGVLLFVEDFLLLGGTQLAYTNAYGKLLAAVVALEYQLLTLGILCFIERDETIAFGTSYSLHVW